MLPVLSGFAKFIFLMPMLFKQMSCQKGPLRILIGSVAQGSAKCINSTLYQFNVTCGTLDEGLNYTNQQNVASIEVFVSSNTAKLGYGTTMMNLRNLTIRGLTNGTTVSCDRSNTTVGSNYLLFMNIEHLHIENLIFTKCGHTFRYFHSVIEIINTTTIEINNITIQYSNGRGMYIRETTGSLSIKKSNFKGNSYTSFDTSTVLSGGGVLIETGGNTSASYHISACSFIENVVKFRSRASDSTDKELYMGSGHGGGLCFEADAGSNVSLTVVNTYFINNLATFGGGASILANKYNKNISVKVKISSCVFSHNKVSNSIISNGGGLQLLLETGNMHIEVSNTMFKSNKAYFGGGTSIAAENDCNNEKKRVSFTNCTWKHNIASSGAAVDISQMFTSEGMAASQCLAPVFSSCFFIENKVEYNQTRRSLLQESVGNGIFSANLMNAKFNTTVTFLSNTGSAIMGMNTVITFNCPKDANFTDNIGINGGGISLQAFSRLKITSGTRMFFNNNLAKSYGGAIYFHISSDHMLFVRSVCPFYHSINNSEIHFTNNTAEKYGHTIYFTSLLPCQMELSQEHRKYLKPKHIFNNTTYFKFNPSLTQSDIATAPSNFKTQKRLKLFPGEEKALNLSITDNLNNPVENSIFQLFILNENEINNTFKTAGCTSEKKISLLGKKKGNAKVLLQSVGKPILNILLPVKIKPCPPGYKFVKAKSRCICNVIQTYGFKSCESQGEYNAYVHRNVWIGYIETENNNVFASGSCDWFCKSKSLSEPIPKERKHLSKYICSKHREGTLCSKCNKDFAASYNNLDYECIHKENCKYGWLFLILTEFLPFTIMIIFVMVMNINVASGYVQGFLLYCHMLVTITLHPKGVIKEVQETTKYFFHIFYYPLDLKFYYNLPSFCLSEEATAIQNIAMTYLTILYSLFLILAVVVFLRCFSRFRACNQLIRFTTAKNSAIHGLLALFLLSYTRCIEASLILLQPATLYGINGHILSHRVFINGEYSYFGKEHLVYAIPGVVGLVLIMIPSSMLFLYPFLVKLQLYFHIDLRYPKLSNVASKIFMYNTFKPFYDMFYGSFQDDHRYFAGLYLFYRLLISLPFYLPQEVDVFIMTEILFVVFLAIHAIAQPHVKKKHNTIDTLLLTNLLFINGLSTLDYIVSMIGVGVWKLKASLVLQNILVILPMLILILHFIHKYVLKLVWRYLTGRYRYKRLSESDQIMHNRSTGRSSDFTRYP